MDIVPEGGGRVRWQPALLGSKASWSKAYLCKIKVISVEEENTLKVLSVDKRTQTAFSQQTNQLLRHNDTEKYTPAQTFTAALFLFFVLVFSSRRCGRLCNEVKYSLL